MRIDGRRSSALGETASKPWAHACPPRTCVRFKPPSLIGVVDALFGGALFYKRAWAFCAIARALRHATGSLSPCAHSSEANSGVSLVKAGDDARYLGERLGDPTRKVGDVEVRLDLVVAVSPGPCVGNAQGHMNPRSPAAVVEARDDSFHNETAVCPGAIRAHSALTHSTSILTPELLFRLGQLSIAPWRRFNFDVTDLVSISLSTITQVKPMKGPQRKRVR